MPYKNIHKCQAGKKEERRRKEKHKYHTLLQIIIPIFKTYPSEAGIYSINNGLQVLGGYGFCSDFILQQYYRDIRISSIYEGTTGIQSQDLLGRKMMLNNGEGAKLLLEEIKNNIETLTECPWEFGDTPERSGTSMETLKHMGRPSNNENT